MKTKELTNVVVEVPHDLPNKILRDSFHFPEISGFLVLRPKEIESPTMLELMEFLRCCQNCQHILKTIFEDNDPKNAEIPSHIPTLIALGSYIINRTNKRNIQNVLTYCNKLTPDIEVWIIRSVIHAKPSMSNDKQIIKWLERTGKEYLQ